MMNKELINEAQNKIIELYKGDPKRIQHFIKVNSFANTIAEDENLDDYQKDIVALSSLLHDIGIHRCEELYGSSAGDLQELEGPTIAGELLEEIKTPEDIIDRVCYLISKHHTYNDIQGIDWQILIESDFLVNAYEGNLPKEQIEKFRDTYFKTKKGTELLNLMFDL